MNTKLFVGSLAWATTNESLKAHFEQVGTVESADVVMERDNPGRSRGFGFVVMSTEEEANEAVEKLHRSDLEGREINVNVANNQG